MLFNNFIIFYVLIFVASTQGQQKCRTPSGPIGHCVEFNSCEPFHKMKQRKSITPEDEILIEKSSCGTVNGVLTICCPIDNVNKSPNSIPISPTVSRNSFTDLSTHPNAKLLPLQKCGARLIDKILGGGEAALSEFPWMVMLRKYSSKNQPEFHCGGTLISNRYVLTAAHCLRLTQGEIRIHSVVIGEHNTTTDPDCLEEEDDKFCANLVQEIPIEKTIPHPNFSTANGQNDIGLVRLKWDATISESVLPICIPIMQEAQAHEYQNVIVTGWGLTEFDTSSNVLLKVLLNITPNDECSKIYQRHYGDRLQVNDNNLCAFGGLKDACHGDSGGPAANLVPIRSVGSRMFQYGIVSLGMPECKQNNGVPGLYTRVTSYVQWILDNISP